MQFFSPTSNVIETNPPNEPSLWVGPCPRADGVRGATGAWGQGVRVAGRRWGLDRAQGTSRRAYRSMEFTPFFLKGTQWADPPQNEVFFFQAIYVPSPRHPPAVCPEVIVVWLMYLLLLFSSDCS